MAGLVRVSSSSKSKAVAGAIAGIVRADGRAEIQAIGAGAISQAVKAMAIARSYLKDDAIQLVFVPSFYTVDIDGEIHTAMHFAVHHWQESRSEGSLPVALLVQKHGESTGHLAASAGTA